MDHYTHLDVMDVAGALEKLLAVRGEKNQRPKEQNAALSAYNQLAQPGAQGWPRLGRSVQTCPSRGSAKTLGKKADARFEAEGRKLPGLDSNQDKENQNPTNPRRKSRKNKQIAMSSRAGCSTGCSDQQSEGGVPDADLAALITAWPTLPDHIRAAIRALVGTVAPPPPPC